MGIFVAAFSGSLRNESYNSKLVRAFQKLAPASVTSERSGITDLSLLNEDLEPAQRGPGARVAPSRAKPAPRD
jgi:chromate reductase, NAD(P)H dehydrogenase (quinone)